jgi:hypothetical protein
MALGPNRLFFRLLFRPTRKESPRSHWLHVVLSCIVRQLNLDRSWPFVMVVNIMSYEIKAAVKKINIGHELCLEKLKVSW